MRTPITTRREETDMPKAAGFSRYLFSCFSSIRRRTTAPYTLPRASTPTPSAPLCSVTVDSMSSMKYLTEPSFAADPDPLLPAGVVRAPRFRIGDIDGVVARDVDPARPAELLPLIDEAPVLIEDLDSVVRAVADKQPS